LEGDVTTVGVFVSVRAVFGFNNKYPETANASSDVWQKRALRALAVNRKGVDLLSEPPSLKCVEILLLKSIYQL